MQVLQIINSQIIYKDYKVEIDEHFGNKTLLRKYASKLEKLDLILIF